MENKLHTFDLASFRKSNETMVATSEQSYTNNIGRYSIYDRNKDYTKDQIEDILKNGSLETQIDLSRNYFNKSGFYKRIVLYYATMLKFSGVLIPNPARGKDLSNSNIQSRYYDATDFIERANIKELFTNCSIRAIRDGAYYGIILVNDKKSFALLDLPTKYCTSRFKDVYGRDVVEFDVSYFNTITDPAQKKAALEAYPKIISKYYDKWNKGKLKSSWMVIPSNIGVCFPLLDGRPFFLNVIPATIKYDEAVETEQARELEEIKKIIVQKIPHMQDGSLLFEPEEAVIMHDGLVGMAKSNKNVSVLTTYGDISCINSNTSETKATGIEKMSQNIFNEAGASGQIFSSTSSQSLAVSIKNDISLMMMLANKYSSFLTNLVNSLYSNSNINFTYTIMPISYYNESDYISDSFKLAQSGYSYLLPALALGMSQRDLCNLKDLENSFLQLQEKLLPLGSAYTQSANVQENGRPSLKEEEKAEQTIKNEEALDNQGGSD